jgi:uncharacterized protein
MKQTLFFFLLLSCVKINAQSPSGRSRFFALGVIDTLKSMELNETRTLNIYLPEGYNEDTKASFPVIYLLDGSADEDFIHIAGLVQFANFSWIKLLPPSIVVGIANVDRKRDFTYPTTIEKDKKDFPTTGSSAKFIQFIEKELQPYIEKNYRTNSDKMIIGQSLGGLLATEILFKKPNLFNQYVIVSPSLWWDNQSLFDVPKVPISQQTKVYITVGKEGKIMENSAKKLAKALKSNNLSQLTVKFELFKDKNHATILHSAAYRAFEWMGSVK